MIMKALKILFVVILVAIAHGCIRNDGNIGPIWGLWRVTNIEVDGKSIENYEGNLYFGFQASVFMQKVVDEATYSDSQASYALWMYEGEDLKILFTEDRYKPVAISGFQHKVDDKPVENIVKVRKMKGNDMHLEYVNPDGVTYFYKLKRW